MCAVLSWFTRISLKLCQPSCEPPRRVCLNPSRMSQFWNKGRICSSSWQGSPQANSQSPRPKSAWTRVRLHRAPSVLCRSTSTSRSHGATCPRPVGSLQFHWNGWGYRMALLLILLSSQILSFHYCPFIWRRCLPESLSWLLRLRMGRVCLWWDRFTRAPTADRAEWCWMPARSGFLSSRHSPTPHCRKSWQSQKHWLHPTGSPAELVSACWPNRWSC